MQEKYAGLARRKVGQCFYLAPTYDLNYSRAQWEHYRKLLLRCCPTLLELDVVAGKELIPQLVAWVQQSVHATTGHFRSVCADSCCSPFTPRQ